MIRRPFGATGVDVSVIGQGTWRMGERAADRKAEVAALRLGIDLGLTHIDTAEMYAEGGAEAVVAEAVAGQRARVFLTTKVSPQHASYKGTIEACEASLRRLRTDCVDLYLLHWWSGRHRIEETMRAMGDLVARGLVRLAGVSNLDPAQMRAAQSAFAGGRLACNQIPYHLRDRAIERDVLPHCQRQGMAVVGYTPLASGGFSRGPLVEIARRLGRTPRQVALNFLTRRPALFTIPKASQASHVKENAAALDVVLEPPDLRAIERAFPRA
jgi:diketogulonate reductase-like aldo/keto reductase